MPIYEYQCEQCERHVEVLQRVDEPPLAECPDCGGPVRKLISAPAFQFKGSGWYVTDYARKGGGAAAGKGGSDGGGEAGGGESASDKKETKKEPAKASGAGSGGKTAGSD